MFCYELSVKDIQQHANSLVQFHGNYRGFFDTSTRSVADHSLDYLKGQLLLDSRRNMSCMAIHIADKDEQSLSHFISKSPWRDDPLIEAIGRDAAQLLSGGSGYPQGAGLQHFH